MRALLLCFLLSACSADIQLSQLQLSLRAAPGCELGSAEGLSIRALGDFPSLREPFTTEAARSAFDEFPLDTRELAIEGRFSGDTEASGRVLLPTALSGETSSILLLPEGRSCPLADTALIASPGVAAAPLADGGLLLAGGTRGSETLAGALHLPAGGTLVEEVPDGMLLRRRYASATAVGERVVVAGGAGAAETYEVFDGARGRFARELTQPLTAGPRLEHGAAKLPDGSVLLIGGRAEPAGAPLATAERIRLDVPLPSRDAAAAPLSLVRARIAPDVLVLESGVLIVAGGRDADGAVVPTLERFEPDSERFVELPLTLRAYEHAAAVALPGSRIAWLGCDTLARRGCGLELVLLRGEVPLRVDAALDWTARVPRGLVDVRALALADGRVLITGRDPDGSMQSRALVADLDTRELVPYEATRAPSVLASLADGAIVELDAVGASLRRLGSVSAYESPQGDLLSSTPSLLAFDAPDRWQRTDEGVRARLAGARLDLARLALGAFRLKLALQGRALLVLRAAGVPELAWPLATGERPLPDCPPLGAASALRIERHGRALDVWSETAASARCRLEAPSSGPLWLALEAEADTELRRFEVSRL
ncbi:MAG TPA: hypothetical protein VJR89_07465 [Polyangiales bacterium]|nr:hypothetical protein [Polyangiales bacterium]